MARIGRYLVTYWRQIVIFLTPVLFSPLPIILRNDAATAGYVMIVMAIYWSTDVLPLAVTGLLPLVFLPLAGILPLREVAKEYMKDSSIMLVAALILAGGIEDSQLHRRIALNILKYVGTHPNWLMLGFMLPTWLLSMWIKNSAATAMMLPIVDAVMQEIETSCLKNLQEVEAILPSSDNLQRRTHGTQASLGKTMQKEREQERQELRHMFNHMTFAVAFAANVGGMCTLTGTGANVVMKQFADDLWMKHENVMESPVTYTSWIVFGLPVSCMCFLIIWLWLQLYSFGPRKMYSCITLKGDSERDRVIQAAINKEYNKLGIIRYEEVIVVIAFVITVLLWFMMSPGFMPGWKSLGIFKQGYISTSVVPHLVLFVLFIIPTRPVFGGHKFEYENGKVKTILTWNSTSRRFPWHLLFMVGGGFAIAKATQVTGLSMWMGQHLAVMGQLPRWLMLYIICLVVSLLTEITSNSATCSVLMPIVVALAEGLKLNPLYLMFPITVTTSFAFMLPVATGPNALVFSYGKAKVIDMVKAGAILNVICIIPVNIVTHTLAYS